MLPRRRTDRLPRYQPVPADEHAEATRRAIEESAIRAFRIRGYAATTVDTIAALAGVSPRTVYRYFGSKNELFAATIADGVAQFVLQLSLQMHEMPLRDAIIVAFEYITFEAAEEGREMVRQAAADDKVWGYTVAATSRLQPTLSSTLHAANADKGLGPPSPMEQLIWEVRAGALLCAVSTAFRRWATTPGVELLELVEIAVDGVLPCLNAPADQQITPRR